MPSPILLSGTTVLDGEGFFIAIAVGSCSTYGKIAILIEPKKEKEEPSEDQKYLVKIKRFMNIVGIFFALVTIAIKYFMALDND